MCTVNTHKEQSKKKKIIFTDVLSTSFLPSRQIKCHGYMVFNTEFFYSVKVSKIYRMKLSLF